MATCPVCSDVLLRHIRNGKTYWLCRHCRSEILEIHSRRSFAVSYANDIVCSSLRASADVKLSESSAPALPRS